MSRRTRESEALSLLGLARRAGDVALGTDATRRAVREGEARLVLTAEDASKTQLVKVLRLVRERNVPHRTVEHRSTLGAALGTALASAAAVTNPSLAERILDRLSPRCESGRPGVPDTGGR